MTCKQCYHYQVCVNETNQQLAHRDGAHRCKTFKDTRKVLDLPCAIGDEAYLIVRTDKKDPTEGFIQTLTVAGIHLRDELSRRGLRRKEYLVLRSSYGFSNHIDIDKIGSTLFFDKRVAIAKLKRSEEINYLEQRDSKSYHEL